MKYAVVKCSNGSFSVVSEWDELSKAIVNFHNTCTALWNAEDVHSACIAICDEEMNIHKIELIKYQG